MASIGVVNADTPKTQDSNNTTNRPKKIYFGVFFDGTGNNMVQKATAEKFRKQQRTSKSDDNWDLKLNPNLNKYGAAHGEENLPIKSLDKNSAKLLSDEDMQDISTRGSGYSNIAVLHSVYQAMSDEQYLKAQNDSDIYRYNIYVEGAGTEAVYNDTLVQDTKNALGSGFGNGDTGVVALVSKAVMMVYNIVVGFKSSEPEIHFDVYGFSRGATCARLFAFLAAREGEALGCEAKFAKFQASSLFKNNKLHFLDESEFRNKRVDFLGLYDTVSSIGLTYDNNVKDFGLYSPTLGKVKNTFHLCALDEFRKHFALTDIGDAANSNNAELFIPGCHSDVGGTYMVGKEDFSLIYRPSIFEKNELYVSQPHSKNGRTDTISVETLMKLGWVKSREETFTNLTPGFIDCRRKKVLGGYSNIPLRMMAKRTKTKTYLDKFGEFPVARFDIPKKLAQLGSTMLSLSDTATSRDWFFPGGDYSSTQYRELRSSFLHFSATDTLISKQSSVVHGPSLKNNVICRIVYYGNSDSSQPHYMCDYK